MKVRWILFFLLLFGVLGYVREYFFVNMNIVLYEKYYGHVDVPVPAPMQPFRSFSYEALYYSKYIYTALSVLIFFVLSIFAVKKLGSGKKLASFLIYSYAILVFLAGVSMIYGYFVNNRLQDDEYTFSRWLLGIAQSPIICFILLASEKLYYKSFRS